MEAPSSSYDSVEWKTQCERDRDSERDNKFPAVKFISLKSTIK